jgi:hypothetical protein
MQFPSFHSHAVESKVEGQFVPVNAMKAKRGRRDIYKVTNRALDESKLSTLTPWDVPHPPVPIE